MDKELLIALVVLWLSTTSGLISFLRMWFSHGGEAFHPHSVDVEHRHGLFLVVNSKTVCKHDCVVKSISAFVAPRGSSSSKQFTVITVMIAVAGFLGTSRWFYVGDASVLEATLSFAGFALLLLVAAFELDVVPERFLEDKLIVTAWLIEKLNLHRDLPFRLQPNDEGFRDFIRQSKDIYHLYDEDQYLNQRSKININVWNYHSFWPFLHMFGACSYVSLVPAAIILNDIAEEKVGWITGVLFFLFCFMAYLTGNYVPVLKQLRGWILMWNPFLKEPHFMLKLKLAVEDYCRQLPETKSQGGKPDSKLKKRHGQSPPFAKKAIEKENWLEEAAKADKALDSISLRYARSHPEQYLRIIGHTLVMVELIALMTPSVAMGIQWVTALCDGPPVLSIIELLGIFVECVRSGNCSLSQDRFHHCILRS